MKIRVFAVLVLSVLAAGAMPVAAQQQPAAKSLYDRLGGLYPISALVDDFIDRVFANATLNANPNIYEARKLERKPGLKNQVSTLVCSVTGGPCKYIGLDMKVPQGLSYHREGVAGVNDRFPREPFEVPGTPGGAEGIDRHRREHQGGYGYCFCPKEVRLRAKQSAGGLC